MTPARVRLPDGRVWLRAAQASWADPLDSSFARTHGGRWNPPGRFDALYLNGDVETACAQVRRMLEGTPLTEEDLDDDAPFVLVPATLPTGQIVADAVSEDGLSALGLPATYPVRRAKPVSRATCRPVGLAIHEAGLRGVWCRCAATAAGTGRELAWFPARSSSQAKPATDAPLPYGRWRHATSWADLGFPSQRDPT